MIGKLKGKVDSCFEDSVIVDVGGVGYLVYCPVKTLSKLVCGDACELFIETHVREDHIHLYGFSSMQEKLYFTLLQSVSGIGARMALAILSALSPEQISFGISSKNKEMFRNVPGVGPKLAERMILELKSKLPAAHIISAPEGSNLPDISAMPTNQAAFAVVSDAVSALVNLGINKPSAQNLVHELISQHPDASVSELITLALRRR